MAPVSQRVEPPANVGRFKPARFRELQARYDSMTTSVLSVRLKDLQSEKLLDSNDDDGWHLTAQGRSLLLVLAPLVDWSERTALNPG
jgi:DNA-binding HxlR family transcriptional regulator